MLNVQEFINKERNIAVVGLGYVGLPLAISFSRYFNVIGFDINVARIKELKSGIDHTLEVANEEVNKYSIKYTSNPEELKSASIIIISVPTPIDSHKKPDLLPVIEASKIVGRNLSKNSVVVYESTVYPGVTEEICIPLLQKCSGLTFKTEFSVGYSPERINPGDKNNRLEKIKKIVSGSDQETLTLLSDIYGCIISAGIHKASSIKVAEAAKVIENTQRDINIALMNEFSIIFDKMGIDTLEVLEAAGTKWNFLPFRPGLVGGHCIGVDPYYLTFKAEEYNYHPEVILAGRRLNDSMGKFIAEKAVKLMITEDYQIKFAKIGILGFSFKENVPDIRNTKVIDIVNELKTYGVNVLVSDPKANNQQSLLEYGQVLSSIDVFKGLSVLIIAVGHDEYKDLKMDYINSMFSGKNKGIIIDVKGILNRDDVYKYGLKYWRL